MSFRTVVVSRRSKLDLRLGYLVIRQENETKRIFLEDMNILIVENPACSITGCLLAELVKRKIKVIFCDEKHSPHAELMPCYGSHDCSGKLQEQISWDEDFCKRLWTLIIGEKIFNQARFMLEIGKNEVAEQLKNYVAQLQIGDPQNREGIAAKVYFNALFNRSFRRDEQIAANAALDYGYAMILSAFNREIVAAGYSTQLGICHHNTFNCFNLSSDLMEPFRIMVDRFVHYGDFSKFETKEKHQMLELFNQTLSICKEKQNLINCIRIYVHSIFRAIKEKDLGKVCFCSFAGNHLEKTEK